MCARHSLNLLSFITHASVILWEIVSFSIFPLSKAVIGTSRLIYKQIDNYNQETQCYSGVKILWPVQNNKITISAIQTLHWRNKAISISTSAFSTLKTNIPHHKVKSVIAELINFCFNVCDKQFTGIHKCGATWTDSRQKYKQYMILEHRDSLTQKNRKTKLMKTTSFYC